MASFRMSTDKHAAPLRRLAGTVVVAAAALGLLPLAAGAGAPVKGPGLGEPVDAAQIAAWNLSVYPDGRGLPAGSGTAQQGLSVYKDRCAACHGDEGEGGSGGHLVGRGPLADADPDQAVGNYWPYATTLFDFIRRAMPMDKPGSLSADEIYAVSAYVLYLNRIVELDQTLDAGTLAGIRMPNRDGFIGIDAALPPASR
jgi:cytochrome c